MDIKKITELITNEKPNLKPSSISQYVRCLMTLEKSYHYPEDTRIPLSNDTIEYIKGIKYENIMDLYKDEKVVNMLLSNYHFTTARNYYTAIITLLEGENNPENKPLINKYSNIVKNSNDEYKKENESGIISLKQSDNFVSVETIDTLIHKLKTYDKKGYILFSILKHHHLRNEIATLEIIKLQQYKKLKAPDKRDKNYMVVGTKKLFISRNGYKTDKKYGEIVFEITDKKLNKEVRNYIKGLDGNEEMFSFPDINGEGNDKKKQLSNYMSYVSKKFIGSKISTTILAKIMLSSKYLENKQAQEKDAKERGHSVSVENDVYIKAPLIVASD